MLGGVASGTSPPSAAASEPVPLLPLEELPLDDEPEEDDEASPPAPVLDPLLQAADPSRARKSGRAARRKMRKFMLTAYRHSAVASTLGLGTRSAADLGTGLSRLLVACATYGASLTDQWSWSGPDRDRSRGRLAILFLASPGRRTRRAAGYGMWFRTCSAARASTALGSPLAANDGIAASAK